MNESGIQEDKQSSQQEFDVVQNLERQKKLFKDRIISASDVGLKVDHVKRYGASRLITRYPNATVSVVPPDAHLFPVLLNVASELAPEQTTDYTEPPDQIAQHEGDHVFEINRANVTVKRYGILVTTDNNNGIVCYPFVSYDKSGFKDDLKITLAPLRHGKLSPDDIRALIELIPQWLAEKLKQLFSVKSH